MALNENFITDISTACTDEELAARGKRLAKLWNSARSHETDKKEYLRAWKIDMDAIQGEIDEVAAIVESGMEPRPVECSERYNFEDKMVETVRLDDFTIVRSRPATHLEVEEGRQGGLSLVPSLSRGPFREDEPAD